MNRRRMDNHRQARLVGRCSLAIFFLVFHSSDCARAQGRFRLNREQALQAAQSQVSQASASPGKPTDDKAASPASEVAGKQEARLEQGGENKQEEKEGVEPGGQSLTPAVKPDDESLSQLALTLINEDRTKYGAAPLKENAKLSKTARAYAQFLSTTNFFGHVDPRGRTPQDRANSFGVRPAVAENLAWEESDFEEPQLLVQRAQAGMMAEPAGQINHRFNILNPKNRFVGVAVVKRGDRVMLVQEFTEEEP